MMIGKKGVVLAPDGSVANMEPEDGANVFRFPLKDELPPGWEAHVDVKQLIGVYRNNKKNLRVILSVNAAGKWNDPWIHLSVSRPKATPTHKDMMVCKKLFIGDGREAIAIYPPKKRWVTVHAHCLHLWAPCDSRLCTWPHMEHEAPDGTLQI